MYKIFEEGKQRLFRRISGRESPDGERVSGTPCSEGLEKSAATRGPLRSRLVEESPLPLDAIQNDCVTSN